jgi:hypothetical protein
MKLSSSLDGLCIRCLVFRLFTSRGGEKLQSKDARWRWRWVFVNSWAIIGSSISLIYDIIVFGVGAGTSEEETSCVFQLVIYCVFLYCLDFVEQSYLACPNFIQRIRGYIKGWSQEGSAVRFQLSKIAKHWRFLVALPLAAPNCHTN